MFCLVTIGTPPPPIGNRKVSKGTFLKMVTHGVALQVLCPCAKRIESRDETELLEEPLDDSDTNTLGLSAQDLRDPAAIVSLSSI